MYMYCMVRSGNGASKWAEMLFGHVWGGPEVGTTSCKSQEHLACVNDKLDMSFDRALDVQVSYTPKTLLTDQVSV